jgi:hypothetical protein
MKISLHGNVYQRVLLKIHSCSGPAGSPGKILGFSMMSHGFNGAILFYHGDPQTN